ncbi:MAG: hypothetical protein AAGE86_04180 [Pseudomonadota bacterium]
MTPDLFDPAEQPHKLAGVGPNSPRAAAYLRMLASREVSDLIPNVETKMLALQSGGRVFPVTVNDGVRGKSYVCEPYSAYILYARQELEIIGFRLLKWAMLPLIWLAARLLRIARINRIVHVDNWLLSTNLHGDWEGEDIPAIRALLRDQFPGHIIAIRSLDEWSCPRLLGAVQGNGWSLFPSRQIWVTDDLQSQWLPRNNAKEDHRKIKRSGLSVEDIDVMSDADATRIARLYHMLYVGKYSELNPVFSARWIQLTCENKLIRYRCARSEDGIIQAVAGSLVRGGILTPPVVGYDTAQPQSNGLYRIASWLFCDSALQAGLRLNGSAGASHFKRLRGARAVTEYSAYFIDHLPAYRRWILKLLAAILNRIAVPIMRRYQL